MGVVIAEIGDQVQRKMRKDIEAGADSFTQRGLEIYQSRMSMAQVGTL
jgi:hypothetical protein